MFERRIFQNFWEKDVNDQDREEIGQPVKNLILKKDVINLVFGVFSKSFDHKIVLSFDQAEALV